MEKSGLMPVECVMASCGNVIWRAYRAPAVVHQKRINVSSRYRSDILAASGQARASRAAAPGSLEKDTSPVVPEHPSFQEYCRVCMTKIRGVEEQMRESVIAKDLDLLEKSIEVGELINVDKASITEAQEDRRRLIAEQELLHAQHQVQRARRSSPTDGFQSLEAPALAALRGAVECACANGVDNEIVESGRSVVAAAAMEAELGAQLEEWQKVPVGAKAMEPGMGVLKEVIERAEETAASSKMLERASKQYRRLEVEIELSQVNVAFKTMEFVLTLMNLHHK